ncbi:MAG: translocation/assembly module TamB, partial [Pseudomonadota bacterium]
MRVLRLFFVAWATLAPMGALAQQDDRDILTAFLEDNLSGAGRNVTITGFSGALSSRATVQQMTIADAAGIWITLNGVTLDWSRSSLLSGAVEINALTADEIVVDRLPATDTAALPDPEARG